MDLRVSGVSRRADRLSCSGADDNTGSGLTTVVISRGKLRSIDPCPNRSRPGSTERGLGAVGARELFLQSPPRSWELLVCRMLASLLGCTGFAQSGSNVRDVSRKLTSEDDGAEERRESPGLEAVACGLVTTIWGELSPIEAGRFELLISCIDRLDSFDSRLRFFCRSFSSLASAGSSKMVCHKP